MAPYRDKTGAKFNFKFVGDMANLNKIRSNANSVALFVIQFMAIAAVFLVLYFFYFKHGLKTVFQKNSPKNTSLIRQLFFEDMDSFNIATISEFENKIFFSHAPILKEWVKRSKKRTM